MDLSNIGTPKDFNVKQPTALEKLAYEMSQAIEMRSANLAKQIRTICICLNIKEEDFVKNFTDEMAHSTYVKNTISAQKAHFEEEEKKKAELAKLNPANNK